MFSKSDYQTIGLIEKWEAIRVSEWRGYELVGTTEDGKCVIYFLPDAAIRVLIETVEKPPSAK